MTTSGTASFNLDFAEIVEEAFERNGREMRTGYDLRTARRSMNLLLAEMANRGINLWTVEEGSIPMVTGQSTYSLPVDTVDLLDHVIRTGSGQNQIDINISRIAEPTYSISLIDASGHYDVHITTLNPTLTIPTLPQPATGCA